MFKSRNALITYKIFFSLLGFSAVVTEIATTVERGTFQAANFFSYFTIQNNILLIIAFLISAYFTARGRSPRWLDKLRGATTVYIAVVGVGFAVLLSGLEGVELTAVPWDNTVLHYIMPVVGVIDLLVDRPKSKLRFAPSLLWLLLPVAYLAYSLIRGAIIDWYPYPFLNPSNHGYLGIAVASSGLLVLGVLLVAIVSRISPGKASSK